MVETQHGIEARRLQDHRKLLDQQRVDKREQCIGRIAWRPTIAAVDVEAGVLLEQPGEAGKVGFCRHALDAQQA